MPSDTDTGNDTPNVSDPPAEGHTLSRTNPLSTLSQVDYNLLRADHEHIKRRLGFQPGKIHIAVAGLAETGKSALLNAFRGLRDDHPLAAPTGITETTIEIKRYEDARYPWIVWFDIPGAGTGQSPSADYFERQGLYVMDCIIVLWGDRFTEVDMAVLRGASRWNITALVVRSKSDVHIRNMALKKCRDPDNDDEVRQHKAPAQSDYIETCQRSVERELVRMGLANFIPVSKHFLVSAYKVRQLMARYEDVPELTELEDEANGIVENNVAYWGQLGERLRAHRQRHYQRLISSPGFIDESRLLNEIFTSIAETRY